MTIREIYEKFKHLDKVLSDPAWIDGANPIYQVAQDMWKAIKEEVEGK